MKSLVLWSSRTGNTKKVAEAIYEVLPGEKDILEEGREKDISSYDLIFVGFWAFRRGADMVARRTLAKIEGKKVAIYATAGAWPDSPAAKDYLENAASLLPESSECVGTWICQGRVNSFHTGKRNPNKEQVHPLTPERLERLQEAEKHPDEKDLDDAKKWALEVVKKV
jgi:flavodoxin